MSHPTLPPVFCKGDPFFQRVTVGVAPQNPHGKGVRRRILTAKELGCFSEAPGPLLRHILVFIGEGLCLARRSVRGFRTCAWAGNAPQPCCRVIDTIYSMRRGHIIHCKRAAVSRMRPGTQPRSSSLACYLGSQRRDMGHPAPGPIAPSSYINPGPQKRGTGGTRIVVFGGSRLRPPAPTQCQDRNLYSDV